MPAGDGTGPRGFGPMTGRAAGYCTGFDKPGCVAPGSSRRMGFGFRGGRGQSRRENYEMLQSQIEHLENTLSEFKQRLTEVKVDLFFNTEKQQGGQG